MVKKSERKLFTLPVILAAFFVVGLLALEYGKSLKMAVRGVDNPPTVDFTWTPIGRVSLKEMVGKIRAEDDHAIDFSAFNVEIVELNRVIEVTRSDVIGKSFEQEMSFAMFDGNLELMKHGQMTLRISVADDAAQETVIERVVKLKTPEESNADMLGNIQLIVD